MKRYNQIIEIVKEVKPRVILEVGTWNGSRAAEMLFFAAMARPGEGLTYLGFDLFDSGTEDDDVAELNAKARVSRDMAMHIIVSQIEALSQAFEFPLDPEQQFKIMLCEGNTRNTLKKKVREFRKSVDFAFIDGGHSVETIDSDWRYVRQMLKDQSTVVFDDYYDGAGKEFLGKWGCNTLYDKELWVMGAELLPVADGPFKHLDDGSVRLVRLDLGRD